MQDLDVTLVQCELAWEQPADNRRQIGAMIEALGGTTDLVVLPELVAAFDGQLRPGVVTDVYGDGLALKRQYGFPEYPSLVFVRDGDYVGTISRIRDWQEYLARINELFVAEPRRRPGIPIEAVSA